MGGGNDGADSGFDHVFIVDYNIEKSRLLLKRRGLFLINQGSCQTPTRTRFGRGWSLKSEKWLWAWTVMMIILGRPLVMGSCSRWWGIVFFFYCFFFVCYFCVLFCFVFWVINYHSTILKSDDVDVFLLGLHFCSKKTEFLDKSSKTIDTLSVFFEPNLRQIPCFIFHIHLPINKSRQPD